jgi:hypothetical protein
MMSGEIAERLNMCRNTVARWAKRGLVRSKDSGVKRVHVQWMLYCFEDCEAQIGKRKRLEPFKHKDVDGVRVFCCNYCREWKQKQEFYPDASPLRQHGILSYCKSCHNERQRSRYSPEKQRKYTANKLALSKQRKLDADAATDWKPDLLDAGKALEVILSVRPDVTDVAISLEAGLNRSSVGDIRKRAMGGANVTVSKVDAVLTGLGEPDAMRRLYDDLDEGRPRWHPKYDYCSRCLRTEVAHMAAGLCSTCYRKRKDPTYVPWLERQWSKTRTCCVECLTTDRPHRSHGMCNACYMRASRAKKALMVGSGHGDVQPQEQG